MIEASCGPDLTQESLRPECCSEFRMKKFERDGTIVLKISGEVNGGHAAAPEFALDPIAVGERSLKVRQGVWQISR
jgi:hypothetical protein